MLVLNKCSKHVQLSTASLKSSTHVSAASARFFFNYALTVMTRHSVFMTTFVD